MQGTEIQCTTHNGCCAHGLVVVHPNVQSGRSHELHCAKAAVTVEAELDSANCGSQDCGCESQLLLEYLSSASTDAKSASVITPTALGVVAVSAPTELRKELGVWIHQLYRSTLPNPYLI